MISIKMSEVTYPAIVAATVRATWDGPERTGDKVAALFPVHFLCGIGMTWHLEHTERAGFSVYSYYGSIKVHIRVFRSGVPIMRSLQISGKRTNSASRAHKTGGVSITASDGVNRAKRFGANIRLGPKTPFHVAINRIIKVCTNDGALWLENVLRPHKSV